MRWRLFLTAFLQTLFVLYCIEAGALLVIAPWKDLWLRFVSGLSWDGARTLLLHPLSRSVITGFGLVHIVWGIHDLEQLLRSRGGLRPQTGEETS